MKTRFVVQCTRYNTMRLFTLFCVVFLKRFVESDFFSATQRNSTRTWLHIYIFIVNISAKIQCKERQAFCLFHHFTLFVCNEHKIQIVHYDILLKQMCMRMCKRSKFAGTKWNWVFANRKEKREKQTCIDRVMN